MGDIREKAAELDRLVEVWATRDWRVSRTALEQLVAAGEDGIAAAVRGLQHSVARVRRASADFLDHHAADAFVDDLRRVALTDPVPNVRRAAVHAIGCIACKPVPLSEDMIDFLAGVATDSSENLRVRHSAIWVLNQQQDSSRVASALRLVLEEETDRRLRLSAHRVLRLHDPDYRRTTDAAARAASEGRRQA
jgi:HEAT repeat protein